MPQDSEMSRIAPQSAIKAWLLAATSLYTECPSDHPNPTPIFYNFHIQRIKPNQPQPIIQSPHLSPHHPPDTPPHLPRSYGPVRSTSIALLPPLCGSRRLNLQRRRRGALFKHGGGGVGPEGVGRVQVAARRRVVGAGLGDWVGGGGGA